MTQITTCQPLNEFMDEKRLVKVHSKVRLSPNGTFYLVFFTEDNKPEYVCFSQSSCAGLKVVVMLKGLASSLKSSMDLIIWGNQELNLY